MSDVPTTPFDTLPSPIQRKISILTSEYRRLCSEITDKQYELSNLPLAKEVSELISTRDEIALTLKDLALTLDIRKVPCYFIRMSRTSISINPNKLAERGVGIEIIEYATERKESKPWIEILDPEVIEEENINLSAFD